MQTCRSEAAAAELKPSGALAGKGRAWVVEPCTVSGSGQTSNCGGQLQGLDLEDHEWEQFTEGIAQLATKQERKPKDFEAFKVGPGADSHQISSLGFQRPNLPLKQMVVIMLGSGTLV